MTVLVGADPEVFVKKDGKFRSAHGLIPGTKQNPHPVKDGAVQVDGLALEYNINAAATREEFIHNNVSVLSQLSKMVPDYEIVIESTAKFHGAHLKAQPEEALELGCEPDFDAYTERENPRPNAASTMRTAAGHVHIGFRDKDNLADPTDPNHIRQCITLVRHLDAFLGIPSLCWDKDTLRRTMYGKAGAFRPKSYGVEYRTLSNQWLKSEELMGYVFDQVQACVEFLKAGNRLDSHPKGYAGITNNPAQYINTSYGSPEYMLRQWFPFVNQPPKIR